MDQSPTLQNCESFEWPNFKVEMRPKQYFCRYGKRISTMKQFVHKDPNTAIYEQDVSPSGRHHHLTMLPKNVQLMLEAVSPILDV